MIDVGHWCFECGDLFIVGGKFTDDIGAFGGVILREQFAFFGLNLALFDVYIAE